MVALCAFILVTLMSSCSDVAVGVETRPRTQAWSKPGTFTTTAPL